MLLIFQVFNFFLSSVLGFLVSSPLLSDAFFKILSAIIDYDGTRDSTSMDSGNQNNSVGIMRVKTNQQKNKKLMKPVSIVQSSCFIL